MRFDYANRPQSEGRFKCKQCNEPMPLSIVCQAYMVDGKLEVFHLGCFETWFDFDLPIIRVTHDGNSFVTREPYRPEPYEEVTLVWETMKQGKYYALKEFRGF